MWCLVHSSLTFEKSCDGGEMGEVFEVSNQVALPVFLGYVCQT